ncbi:RNA 2',3'-cyclic phosphodiesterase [archaeon]|jgi:RNA 2',3'-cyclic 3'-phosphodiesterase|nr:RNA 2',3'-cyclic phosphodiesterase [archaeon]MBT3730995.1 RNA 2',3'-cyclic phosphodiesterase [archaeon]MBT4669767.1 RNA 2',3'-cyclic phosphodiesterase [archaeon]MBT5029917.1 RNA 2',3'-cyclic phosphodiesterase [archaeon]MBT5288489.1 RNA 2',3'-cyclic phosphodiesterase [archaeon]
MKVFVAVDLSKEIKDYLFDLQKEVKEAKITWVSKKNLHLTLKFVGDIKEEKLPQIKEALSNIKFNKVKVNLGKLGFFPNQKSPKVIWVSLEPEDNIIQLQQKVDEALLTIFPSEQLFQSHLTLGRVKLIRRDKDFQSSLDNIQIKPIELEISSIKLFQSELTRAGPRYTELHDVNLS